MPTPPHGNNRFRHFVDRRQAVALLADLCQRDPKRPPEPLPIIAFLAPGGGGKTTLLELLATRCQGVVPTANIEPDDLRATDGYFELLFKLSEQLKVFSNRNYQRLPLPRFDLGVEVVTAELAKDNPGAVRQGVRQLLVDRQRFLALLKELGVATNHWLVTVPAVLLRRLLPWLNEQKKIAGRRPTGQVLTWYRQHATDLHLTGTTDGLDTLVRLHEWSRPWRNTNQRMAADRLLLEALLTDLEQAYDVGWSKTAAERTVNPVLIVDDFDRLIEGGAGERLLRDLVARRVAGHFDPLLVVVSSNQRMLDPLTPEQSPPFEERDETLTAVSPVEYARDVHQEWLRANRAEPTDQNRYLLPFWLHDFGLVDGAALLASRLWPARRIQLEHVAFLARVHNRTKGHPLALTLAADAVAQYPEERDAVALDEVFRDQPRYGRPSIASILLDSLLSKHDVEADGGWTELAAVPRRVTPAGLEALLGFGAEEARRRWDWLQRRTFTRLEDRDREELAFHPVLRHLLLQRLEPQPDRYQDAHEKLHDHFSALSHGGHTPARAETLYHALALGDMTAAVAEVATAVAARDPLCDQLLAAATEAPTVHLPADGSAQVTKALHDMRIEPSPDHVAKALVLCSWRSNESGQSEQEQEDRLYDLAESHRQLRRIWPKGGHDPAALYMAAAQKSRGTVSPALNPATLGPEPPPVGPFSVRSVSHALRNIGRIALALVLCSPVIFYSVVYFNVAGALCSRPDFFSVGPTISTTLDAKHISAFRAENGECIGISDGRYAFDQWTDERAGRLKARAAAAKATGDVHTANTPWHQAHDTDTSDPEPLIYQENERVLALSRNEKLPYVTIVAFTTLTAFSESRTAIGGGRDELQGIYVAQREHNDEFRVPLVRVLVANAGGNYAYAPQVATQIVEAARDDPSIVAVTAISESRQETIEAIRIFSAARIPMMSSTASSDQLSGISPYFFRVAPANRHQVEMGARFAVEQLHAKNAVLFKAVNDNYSESLAKDFVQEFVDRGGKTLLATETYDAKDRNISNVILEKVGHACSFNPDLIYFTGRTDYMIRLLNSMNPCSDNSVRLMGADELYQLITPPNSGYPPYAYDRLYFTAFAFPTMWEQSDLAKFTPSFYRRYAELFDPAGTHRDPPTYGYNVANGHVVLAHDAMLTLLTGIIGTVRMTGSTQFEPTDLVRSLTEIRGERAIQGAGGRIEFGVNHDPIDKVVVMLRVDTHGNTELVQNGILGRLRK